MGYEPQHLVAPDGTELVVITARHYQDLLDAIEDAGDVALAEEALREMEEVGGGIPGDVLYPIRDEGVTPVASWRRYRGMSQAALARAAGISQVWLGRIEAGVGYGKPHVRKALAAALDAPEWTLDIGREEAKAAASDGATGRAEPTRFPSKSAEIRHLLDKGMTRVEIAKQVGVRYQFVRNVDVARTR